MTDYPADELVEVSATGAACFIVHRDVLAKIRANYGDRWFDRVEHPKGARFSEDLSFFVRVAGVDAPIYVHTGIPTSHDKGGVFLRETEFRRQQQETTRPEAVRASPQRSSSSPPSRSSPHALGNPRT